MVREGRTPLLTAGLPGCRAAGLPTRTSGCSGAAAVRIRERGTDTRFVALSATFDQEDRVMPLSSDTPAPTTHREPSRLRPPERIQAHVVRCSCEVCGTHTNAVKAFRIAGSCPNCGSFRLVPGRGRRAARRRPARRLNLVGPSGPGQAGWTSPTGWPLAVRVTSMLPRVALEYGHTWCAVATMSTA